MKSSGRRPPISPRLSRENSKTAPPIHKVIPVRSEGLIHMSDELAHVCLNVPDAAEAAEWYCENFDFEVAWTWTGETERGQLINYYVAGETGAMIQFRERDQQTAFDRGDAWDHIGIVVDDVDETVERIDHGGIVMAPQDNPNSEARIAFVEDPNGYVVELFDPFDG